MKMKIYVIFDSKIEAYHNPFFAQADREALTMIYETAKDPKTTFNKYPEDYTLFYIGNYNQLEGTIEPSNVQTSLGSVLNICMAFKRDMVNLNEQMEKIT
nr:MAG: nonstructural protein [Microvirus sp.]